MPVFTRLKQALTVLILLGLAACESTPTTQTVDGSGPPYRTMSDGDDKALMIQGYDPVAYFTEDAAVAGNPSIKAEHDGVTYRFASEQHKSMFTENPSKYAVQYGGYCSNGINYAIPGGGGGGPNTWRIYRGKLYVFGGQQARDHFEMDTEHNLALTRRYWRDEVHGRNPTLTRLRKMINKVPHYKTDAALQTEWEAKRDAGTLPVMPGGEQVIPQ
ncbi:MAG: YHS domain-containing (seleno)protein [Burkholderiaceae bacterium]